MSAARWIRHAHAGPGMQVLEAALDTVPLLSSPVRLQKAVGIAREMLALDSINSSVRERLRGGPPGPCPQADPQGADRTPPGRAGLPGSGPQRPCENRDRLTAGLTVTDRERRDGASALRRPGERLRRWLAAHPAGDWRGRRLPPRSCSSRSGSGSRRRAGGMICSPPRQAAHLPDGGGEITGGLIPSSDQGITDALQHELSKGETEAACEKTFGYATDSAVA